MDNLNISLSIFEIMADKTLIFISKCIDVELGTFNTKKFKCNFSRYFFSCKFKLRYLF